MNIDELFQILDNLRFEIPEKEVVIIKTKLIDIKPEPLFCENCKEYLRDMDWIRVRTHLWILEHRLRGNVL